MKFSEIDPESWPELQPYMDTCLLPLSGLTGEEAPGEATEAVARTGRWLSPLEQAFRGRTVTMPASHYESGGEEHTGRLNRLIASWKELGFRYVVVVCGRPLELPGLQADLYVRPGEEGEEPDDKALAKAVADMWRKRTD